MTTISITIVGRVKTITKKEIKKKESKNQTKIKNEEKRLRAITFAISKLEYQEQYSNRETSNIAIEQDYLYTRKL